MSNGWGVAKPSERFMSSEANKRLFLEYFQQVCIEGRLDELSRFVADATSTTTTPTRRRRARLPLLPTCERFESRSPTSRSGCMK